MDDTPHVYMSTHGGMVLSQNELYTKDLILSIYTNVMLVFAGLGKVFIHIDVHRDESSLTKLLKKIFSVILEVCELFYNVHYKVHVKVHYSRITLSLIR